MEKGTRSIGLHVPVMASSTLSLPPHNAPMLHASTISQAPSSVKSPHPELSSQGQLGVATGALSVRGGEMSEQAKPGLRHRQL